MFYIYYTFIWNIGLYHVYVRMYVYILLWLDICAQVLVWRETSLARLARSLFFHWTALKTFYFFHWLGEMAENSHWHCEKNGIRASNDNYLEMKNNLHISEIKINDADFIQHSIYAILSLSFLKIPIDIYRNLEIVAWGRGSVAR